MSTPEIDPPDPQKLRQYLRDLAVLTAFPPDSSARDRLWIAETLADVVVRILNLDFAYVQLTAHSGERMVQVTRGNSSSASADLSPAVSTAFAAWLQGDPFASSAVSLPHPFGGGPVRAAVTPIGYEGEYGTLVTASQQADFPSEEHQLLLRVVVSQAAAMLQHQLTAEALTQSKRFEQRLATKDAVTRALAESPTLSDAAPKVLRVVCEHLGWEVGGLWYVDQNEQLLRCSEVWHRSNIQLPQFEQECRRLSFAPGVGLPGRIWVSRQVTWIPDLAQDENFPRAEVAAKEGLRAALGFPIVLHNQVLGVMEFFSSAVRLPDTWLLPMMRAIGSQLGQFIERKRTEEALRQSEQHFRLMAEMIPSIIWTAAPDGAITYANEQWFRYCGLTAEQNARNWPELVLHPEDRQRCTEEWSRALKQGIEYEIEVRNRRHDGSYRWFVTRAIPFRDSAGRLLQWFGVTTDIDDRKRAEQTTRFLADVSKALAHLTDYHSTLQRIASLAVPFFADWCAVDMQEPDGSVRRLALTHTDPGKAKFAQELALRYPAQPLMPPLVMRVLQTGEPDWTAEISEKSLVKLAQDEEHLRLLKQLGLRSSLCVPLCSRSQTLGALTFVTAESGRVYDINDLRAAEELAHRATIAIENANLLAALKESDRRKDEFLAMLAHELRNPLAPIGNAVEILRTKETAAPGLRWANDIIARQLRQMTRLVDDLLDVSRITRGKIELRKERIELSAVVNSAVEASRPLIEKDRHELTILLPHEPIHLHADLTRLSQVISNLLNNAAKYTEPGGHIWLTAERQEGQVLIRVRDTGIGIQANMLPHIFEMFLQTDRSRERSQGGLGIGLSLVRRLVELHGGRVEAHSPGPGRGSEFIVHLPLSQNAGPKLNHVQDRPASHSSTRQDHRLKVLVVDDNTDSADSLAMLVEGLGSEVRTAYDGQEAVEVAAEFSPELVLLDLGLPKLNGYEAARAIRQQPGGDTILLVAVTGWGQEDDRRRSREAGFNHHLTKPVEFPTLQKLLAEASRVHSQAPG